MRPTAWLFTPNRLPSPTSYTQAASPAARPTLPTAGATSISA